MTVTSLHDLLAAAEAEWHADRDDTIVTPSAAGTLCRRRLAYQLTLTPPTDERDPVTVATVGTLLGIAINSLWMDDPDTLGVEVPCPAGGTADVVQRRVIRDTKSVSSAKFDRWERQGGPPEEVWDQLLAYGHRLQADPGWTLVVDAICRETGRCATYTTEFDPEAATAVEEGLTRLQDRYSVGDPDTAPADRSGRGDWFCDSCPWATRCLGPDERPNISDLSVEEATEAAEQYAAWSAVARDATAKAEAARNALRGTTGTFGGWTVAWSERPAVDVPAYVRRAYSVITVKEAKP